MNLSFLPFSSNSFAILATTPTVKVGQEQGSYKSIKIVPGKNDILLGRGTRLGGSGATSSFGEISYLTAASPSNPSSRIVYRGQEQPALGERSASKFGSIFLFRLPRRQKERKAGHCSKFGWLCPQLEPAWPFPKAYCRRMGGGHRVRCSRKGQSKPSGHRGVSP
jgi:hypothetical protein